jgi:hypothetical protein
VGRKALPPVGYGLWQASFSSRGLILKVKKFPLPETLPIWKSYIFLTFFEEVF